MEMKQYLLDTFIFNDFANKNIIRRIKELPDKSMSIKFLSHLINSQNKWLARLAEYPNAPKLDWWEPVYDLEKIEEEWTKSLHTWIEYLESKTEEEIFEAKKYIGFDGGVWEAALKDIALQLN